MTKTNKDSFAFGDFLNGLFVGGVLGASYVYFFHHPKGKKLFDQLIKHKEEIWQAIKQELEQEEFNVKSEKITKSLKKIKTTGRKKITTFLSSKHYLPTKPNKSGK